jgi:hypothetical protein
MNRGAHKTPKGINSDTSDAETSDDGGAPTEMTDAFFTDFRNGRVRAAYDARCKCVMNAARVGWL